MDEKAVKVLIVDDEPGLTSAISGFLRLKGYQTIFTGDAEEAVRLFEEHQPEICILDVQLYPSKFDGVEVMRRIKAIKPTTQCLVITTRHTDPEWVNRALRFGVDDMLLKPFDIKYLVSIVNELALKLMRE